MAVDLRQNPWKFDAATQGEGEANSGTLMLIGAIQGEADDEKFTIAGHGLQTGDGPVQLTGTVPTGTATGTDYWVIRIDNDDIYLATSLANALAETNLSISTDGSSCFLWQYPIFDHKIYVKNIAIIGDGTNDGTVEVRTKSGGPILARAEIFSAATAAEANVIVPVYCYVEGVYINTLDAANAIVLVYHGK
jgi:hypothetical protein